MGSLNVRAIRTQEDVNRFYLALLSDIRAMDTMVKEQLFEREVQKIGAEQELCLLSANFQPAISALDLLSQIDDEHYTSELALYNLEINLDPQVLVANCFEQTRSQLERLLDLGRQKAGTVDDRLLLTGILPTLRRAHLDFSYMTPLQRYRNLSEALFNIRGKDFEIYIQGVDELITSLPTVLYEACNTSFQLHLQVRPEDFVDQYNWAQMIAGPVLAVGTNSPLLLGKELWYETRVALFKQSLDTRNTSNHLRTREPRVGFGVDWIRHSVTELFKDQITRFPVMLYAEPDEIPADEMLRQGKMPALKALRLHNGTTYSWNRPCYGLNAGMAHLRIECRYLPSGPSVVDELANFVFWVGLMKGLPQAHQQIWLSADFRDAKNNFIKAARYGLDTAFDWFGQKWSAKALILNKLIPMARRGLEKASVNTSDIDYYLNVISERVDRIQTGAHWQIRNFRKLKQAHGPTPALGLLTQQIYRNQLSDRPVHRWPDVSAAKRYFPDASSPKIEELMTTDLFVLQENVPVALAEAIMKWKNLHHILIENSNNDLVGVFSATDLANLKSRSSGPALLGEVMKKQVLTIGLGDKVSEAVRLMKDHAIHCLPVMDKDKLAGIVTSTDLKKQGWLRDQMV